MADWAIIFDVDGVLLELTRAEEEVFFKALSRFVKTDDLSRDWNSYKIRNDDDIIREILERNSLPKTLKPQVIAHYVDLLRDFIGTTMTSISIPGASDLLEKLRGRATLGIATANLLAAARLRLTAAKLWDDVAGLAQGADGGGHKSEILARLLARVDIPAARVIFIGDNLNDFAAASANGTHFIAFSTDLVRQELFQRNGASPICSNHVETAHMIERLLA